MRYSFGFLADGQQKATKINPEIAIGEINTKTFQVTYNQNNNITNILINCGYKKLKDNLYFESMLPRFNGFIKTKDFNINNIAKKILFRHDSKVNEMIFNITNKSNRLFPQEILNDKIRKGIVNGKKVYVIE